MYVCLFGPVCIAVYKIWTSGLCPEIKILFSRFLPKLGVCLYYTYQHRNKNHLRKIIFKKALKHTETHNISIKTNMLPPLACSAHVPLVQWYPSATCGPAPVKQTWKIRVLAAQVTYIYAIDFLVFSGLSAQADVRFLVALQIIFCFCFFVPVWRLWATVLSSGSGHTWRRAVGIHGLSRVFVYM